MHPFNPEKYCSRGLIENKFSAVTKLAFSRFLRDKRTIRECVGHPPFYYEEGYVNTAIAFCEREIYINGARIQLQDWQKFIIANLFGFVTKEWKLSKKTGDPQWRFKESYLEIARKNGKTTLAAIILILRNYFMVKHKGDCFVIAMKLDQSALTMKAFQEMVRSNPKRLGYITTKHRMESYNTANKGVIKALANNPNTLDGLNVSCCVVDEYHAFKSNDTYNVMKTGSQQHHSPLTFITTTAGHNINHPCYEEREGLIQVMEGKKMLNHKFCLIFCMDKEDDWQEEKNWIKSNPSLNSNILHMSNFREEFQSVLGVKEKEFDYRIKNLNQWGVNHPSNLDFGNLWVKCGGLAQAREAGMFKDSEKKEMIVVGLDLSFNCDYSAMVGLAYYSVGSAAKYTLRSTFFMTEEKWQEKMKVKSADSEVLKQLVHRGEVIVCAGNSIGMNYVIEELKKWQEESNGIMLIASDSYRTTEFQQALSRLAQDGTDDFTERYKRVWPATPSWAISDMLQAVRQQNIYHANSPMMAMMANNVVLAQRNRAASLEVQKKANRDPIDGIMATIYAFWAWADIVKIKEE